MRMVEELRAAHGPDARQQALTMTAAMTYEGDHESASLWQTVSRLIGDLTERP